ncbi:hypothetical protein LBMAG42_20820 [Deltaproteobacteria bacterium]|nr:hypothetical protein LBMAG42_20820 [Deltaproteobacteria bacterium]
MWGSLKGSRDYRGGAVLASVVLGSACGLPAEVESGGDDADEGAVVLLAAAEKDLLWRVTNGPAEALAAAKAWDNTELHCPGRLETYETMELIGGCTTDGGVRLSGKVRVEEAPDGGSWVFEEWVERRVDETTRWSGNLSWVQTDGANNLTAYDFVAEWWPAERRAARGTYPYAAFLLDDQGRALSATGAVTLHFEGAGDPIALDLAGAWAYDGCDANPTSGGATWTAAESESGDAVTASFDGLECGACVPWVGSGGEAGEWCE